MSGAARDPERGRLERWTRELLTFAPHAARFGTRVVRAFLHNRGILLAGGVGFNILLSVVPLLTILAVMLTFVIDEQRLFTILEIQARQLAPGHANLILDAVRTFLDSRDVIGWTSIGVLLFFSSFAFRMLEDAIAILFHMAAIPHVRSFWVSALLPYAFIVTLGVGLLVAALAVAALGAVGSVGLQFFGIEAPFDRPPDRLLDLAGFVGLSILFTSIYKVMPVTRISLRRAAAGGVTAAVLWEGVRAVLVYYFTSVSMVNLIYGSFATLIVVLISLEIGSIILLLGAQVIVELESSAAADVPWHVDPRAEDAPKDVETA